MSHLIDATEMYLRTLYELEEEGIRPIRARLVERLHLSAPAVSDGAGLLARAIAASFYRDDVEIHYRDLLAYAKPELLGDEWTDAEAGQN